MAPRPLNRRVTLLKDSVPSYLIQEKEVYFAFCTSSELHRTQESRSRSVALTQSLAVNSNLCSSCIRELKRWQYAGRSLTKASLTTDDRADEMDHGIIDSEPLPWTLASPRLGARLCNSIQLIAPQTPSPP